MDTNLVELIRAMSDKRFARSQDLVLIVGMIVAAVAPTLASIVVYFKAKAAESNSVQTKVEIIDLKKHVNSRMDELLKTTGESAHAAGAAEKAVELQTKAVELQTTHVTEVAENGSKFTAEQVKIILEAINKQQGK